VNTFRTIGRIYTGADRLVSADPKGHGTPLTADLGVVERDAIARTVSEVFVPLIRFPDGAEIVAKGSGVQ
jgi:hypothetical protein